MKSLSLSRPLIIVMIGLPGSGKSFFARKFADMFNAPLVSFDYLYSTLFPDPSYSREEEDLVKDIYFHEVEELLKTQRTIVVDGAASERPERQNLHLLARQHDYGVLLVWSQTDMPTAKSRSLRRNPKRAGDELNTSMEEETFASYVKRFTAPFKGEDFVVISGKHTFATQARIVLKKIVSPRAEASQAVALQPPVKRPPQKQPHATSTNKRPNRLIS